MVARTHIVVKESTLPDPRYMHAHPNELGIGLQIDGVGDCDEFPAPKRWFQNRQIRFDGSGGLSSSIEIMVLSAEANTEADIDAFLLRKLNRRM